MPSQTQVSQILNRYSGSYKNLLTSSVVATDMSSAAALLDKQADTLVAVQLVEEGVVVNVPPYTTFTVAVTPSAAVTAGAVALPSGYTVVAGTKLLFEVVLPSGYSNVTWLVGTTQVAATRQALITIPASADGSAVVVTARLS